MVKLFLGKAYGARFAIEKLTFIVVESCIDAR
jgi:hypothetical protein